jgi:hypothetical protein
MNDSLAKLALYELVEPSLESTLNCFEYLNVQGSIGMEDFELIEEYDNYYYVYFKAIKSKIFFRVLVEKALSNHVTEVTIEPGCSVYLNAISRIYSLSEISNLIDLYPTDGWNMGDKKKHGEKVYRHTAFKISVEKKHSGSLSAKMQNLIDHLALNVPEIRRLASFTDCRFKIIQWHFYKGVRGLVIDAEMVNSLSSLNLTIDYEQYLVE